MVDDKQIEIDKRFSTLYEYITWRADRYEDKIYALENLVDTMRFWTLASAIISITTAFAIVLMISGQK